MRCVVSSERGRERAMTPGGDERPACMPNSGVDHLITELYHQLPIPSSEVLCHPCACQSLGTMIPVIRRLSAAFASAVRFDIYDHQRTEPGDRTLR